MRAEKRAILTGHSNSDEFLKTRHSRAGGNPVSSDLLKRLGSRFQRMTKKVVLGLFTGSSPGEYVFAIGGCCPLDDEMKKMIWRRA
jgi:hypothetical protein